MNLTVEKTIAGHDMLRQKVKITVSDPLFIFYTDDSYSVRRVVDGHLETDIAGEKNIDSFSYEAVGYFATSKESDKWIAETLEELALQQKQLAEHLKLVEECVLTYELSEDYTWY